MVAGTLLNMGLSLDLNTWRGDCHSACDGALASWCVSQSAVFGGHVLVGGLASLALLDSVTVGLSGSSSKYHKKKPQPSLS